MRCRLLCRWYSWQVLIILFYEQDAERRLQKVMKDSKCQIPGGFALAKPQLWSHALPESEPAGQSKKHLQEGAEAKEQPLWRSLSSSASKIPSAPQLRAKNYRPASEVEKDKASEPPMIPHRSPLRGMQLQSQAIPGGKSKISAMHISVQAWDSGASGYSGAEVPEKSPVISLASASSGGSRALERVSDGARRSSCATESSSESPAGSRIVLNHRLGSGGLENSDSELLWSQVSLKCFARVRVS